MIVAVKDEHPDSLNWTIQTSINKPFELRAQTLEEKKKFIDAMNRASNLQAPFNLLSDGNSVKLNLALELGKNGYIEQSKNELLAITLNDSNDGKALFYLATCYMIEGREDLALSTYDNVLKLLTSTTSPMYCDVRNNQGLAHFVLGNFEAAKVVLKDAMSNFPSDEETKINLAVVHLELGEYDEAEILLRDLLNSSVPNVTAMLNWSDCMAATNRRSSAIDCLRRLISIHPDSHVGHFKLGTMYEKDGLLALAAESYETAFSLNDRRVDYANSLSNVRLIIAEAAAAGATT